LLSLKQFKFRETKITSDDKCEEKNKICGGLYTEGDRFGGDTELKTKYHPLIPSFYFSELQGWSAMGTSP